MGKKTEAEQDESSGDVLNRYMEEAGVPAAIRADVLVRKGLELSCKHHWVEGVDEDGQLIEPAFDVCTSCGKIQR